MKLKLLNKDTITGGIRHALTFVGGMLVMSGKADAELVTITIGAVMAAVGAIASVIEKVTRPVPTAED